MCKALPERVSAARASPLCLGSDAVYWKACSVPTCPPGPRRCPGDAHTPTQLPAALPAPPRPPLHAALCAGATAALGGLHHLLRKRGPVAALEGELPPLQPQALAAALAWACAPTLHPRQWARGLADGIAPLDPMKVPDRVPPAFRLWMGQTPRESLRAHPWEAGGGRQHLGRGQVQSHHCVLSIPHLPRMLPPGPTVW